MPNVLLTPIQITREALRVLINNLVFISGINRQYSSEFAKTGAKIGSTINVRKPNRYYVRKGPVMQAQNTNETYVPLTLDTQWGVDVNFTSAELTLSLDDFSKRILTPAMARLSSQIDYDGLAQVFKVYNQVGSPGTTPGNIAGAGMTSSAAPGVYLNAGVYLDNNATPRDENRRIILNPAAMAASVGSLAGLFQDAGSIAEQYKTGILGRALGFEFAMDQNVNSLTTGTHAGATVTAPVTVGAISGTGTVSSITLGGFTASSSGVMSTGEIFQIGTTATSYVYALNPDNQQNTGLLQNFTILGATGNTGASYSQINSNASGQITVDISPAIKFPGATVPDATVTCTNNTIASNTSITFMSGAASTSYPAMVAMHQDAFTLGTADLELPQGVDFAARETYNGISMRIVRAFDITNDQFPARIDVLGGFQTLRPELASRITG